MKEMQPLYVATYSEKPAVLEGHPFIVEAGVSLGGAEVIGILPCDASLFYNSVCWRWFTFASKYHRFFWKPLCFLRLAKRQTKRALSSSLFSRAPFYSLYLFCFACMSRTSLQSRLPNPDCILFFFCSSIDEITSNWD